MFGFVLIAAVLLLERLNMLDLGTGPARAKDGDSLVFNGTEVRLHGIDAPELNQTCGGPQGDYACGREARDALRHLLRAQTITCTALDTDRYGRAVSVCRAGNSEINREMVRLGWAVVYIRHSVAYVKVQQQAKLARRGIWRGPFEMPETYRAQHRTTHGNLGGSGDADD